MSAVLADCMPKTARIITGASCLAQAPRLPHLAALLIRCYRKRPWTLSHAAGLIKLGVSVSRSPILPSACFSLFLSGPLSDSSAESLITNPLRGVWEGREASLYPHIFFQSDSRSFFLALHWNRNVTLLFAVSVSRYQENNPFY